MQDISRPFERAVFSFKVNASESVMKAFMRTAEQMYVGVKQKSILASNGMDSMSRSLKPPSGSWKSRTVFRFLFHLRLLKSASSARKSFKSEIMAKSSSNSGSFSFLSFSIFMVMVS